VLTLVSGITFIFWTVWTDVGSADCNREHFIPEFGTHEEYNISSIMIVNIYVVVLGWLVGTSILEKYTAR
jgi:hypothetical protein